ncbi:hypothetical protein EHQ12_03625 [Leptospira gomenensis]|uniref:Uncharacterized protein n=1 Tax=Leptospira gomenensis TaxID=2484974 RepID=A0A5F1YTX6_9LEPT|nr:hypothetical protein [Leptospira gomenensis]TGK31675.1 hypothetical protein EHQ17_12880 [Leptospira gomenensis]TGK43350.1 hypothetical protein EHQ12_03625 [Leptospira gomenensis]TGK61344.1 hypothetical protein EHQ13_08275 [Leptospira gomenensis]
MSAAYIFSGEFSERTTVQNVTENTLGIHNTFASAQILTGYSSFFGANIRLSGSISAPNETDVYKFYLRGGSNETRYSIVSASETNFCVVYAGQEQFNDDLNPDPSLESLGTVSTAETVFTLGVHSVLYFVCSSSSVGNYSFNVESDDLRKNERNGIAATGAAFCYSGELGCRRNCKSRFFL